eukprot:g13607.t1
MQRFSGGRFSCWCDVDESGIVLCACLGAAKTREANAWLSGVFALRYLGWEFALKRRLQRVADVEDDASILVLIVIAALATVVFARSDPLPREEPTSQGPALDKFRAAISLWSDVVIWLLSPTNLAFGFGAQEHKSMRNSRVGPTGQIDVHCYIS